MPAIGNWLFGEIYDGGPDLDEEMRGEMIFSTRERFGLVSFIFYLFLFVSLVCTLAVAGLLQARSSFYGCENGC
jgi:hypothetical protein